MPEPVYLLDFRRMTVEKIDDPTPPAGLDTGAMKLPEDVPFPEATVMLRHFPTAFALARRGSLKAGEWALVMGAAGALGACCVQVARLLGARVIAAAGTALDLNARRAIELTRQLAPLPAAYPNQTLTVHLTFKYMR